MELKHQAATARKWRASLREVERHFPSDLPPIFFLTDPRRIADPVLAVSALPPGTGVIYRHFGAGGRADVAAQLASACASQKLFLLISADPELALSVGAYGVHWPESRLQHARRWQGKFALQTASAHSRRAIWRAACAGMNAVLVSKLYISESTSGGREMGAIRFRQLASQSRLPVYALGGIRADNAARTAKSGGFAAIQGLLD